MENKRLTGEIAIITGSDSAIGQATAIAFAREGAGVAVTYLEDRKGAEHTQPMKRAGEPQEIAHAAVFLASSDAKYIHGTTLFIDGGLTQNVGQGA